MDAFHVVCGMPRSGSTLLTNILNQNPDFYASSTSILDRSVSALHLLWTNSPEIKGEMLQNEEATYDRMRWATLRMVQGWYHATKEPIVFDKGRGWLPQYEVIQKISPNTRLICTVRDPRDVFASVQKQHLKQPMLYEGFLGETLNAKAERYLRADGMIGGPIKQIENRLIQKNSSTSLVYLQYERLVADPERELRRVYAECKLDWYSGHQFEKVESAAIDLDVFYNNKFPHKGEGKVEPSTDKWENYLPIDLGKQIITSFPILCREFGYQ